MKKGNGTTKSVIPAIVIGFLTVICICAAATMLIPIIVINGVIETDTMVVYVTMFRTLAIFVGALVTGMLTQKNKSLGVYMCSGTSLLFFYIMSLLFNSIDSKGVLYGMLCGIVGSVLANIIVIRFAGPKQTKRSNWHSR